MTYYLHAHEGDCTVGSDDPVIAAAEGFELIDLEASSWQVRLSLAGKKGAAIALNDAGVVVAAWNTGPCWGPGQTAPGQQEQTIGAGAKMSDADARAILERVAKPYNLSANAIDLIQGVCRLETGYGRKWQWSPKPCDTGAGSYNWGAVKAGGKAPCPPGTFPCIDEDPKTPYCFATYANDDAGALAVVKILVGHKNTGAYLASGEGSAGDFAAAMKKDGYYTAPTGRYANLLIDNVNDLRTSLGRGPSKAGMWIAGGAAVASALGAALLGWRYAR